MTKTSSSDYIDKSSLAALTIEPMHHCIHLGCCFIINISNYDLSSPLRIKIVIPLGLNRLHLIPVGNSSGVHNFKIIENPTGGATGGTTTVPINKRRDSLKTSIAICTVGVTAPTGGTELLNEKHGYNKEKIEGDTISIKEWVLGKLLSATTYVFELSSAVTDTTGNLCLIWYEVKDEISL